MNALTNRPQLRLVSSHHVEPQRRRWPQVEASLRWFFLFSDADMGLRSNFPAMAYRIQVGPASSGPASYEMPERMIDAARKARRIKRVLDGLDDRTRELVRLAFGLDEVPSEMKPYGFLARLVAQTQAAVEEHAKSQSSRSLADWLGRLPKRVTELEARRAFIRITAEAEQLREQTESAYVEMRRKVGAYV